MAFKKDYTFQSFLLALTVILLLWLIGRIPPSEVGGIKIKQINIFSDLYGTDAVISADTVKEYSDTTFQSESLKATPEAIEEALSTPIGTSQSWDVSTAGVVATPEELSLPNSEALSGIPPVVRTDPGDYGTPATLIEDFSASGSCMNSFYKTLKQGHPRRPVRIAVLGDSFIEADIITVDLREQLQTIYGGSGPGFVPFSSPLAKFRNSVKHTSEGWETYNVMKKKSAPVPVQGAFCISGLACMPAEGAWTRIEGTTFRKGLQRSAVARIIFTNTQSSVIQVTINDSIQSTFTPEQSPLVQQINLRGNIRSIQVRVTSVAGFTGYGIVLEGLQGMGVDNYSLRGNSGMALFGTNTSINAQVGKLLGYDLIVLQYGLNSMSPDILNYNAYATQLIKVINYIRDCYPGCAIMVMSVGDRSTQRAGQYVTMPAAKAMLAAQRKAAEQAGVAFWNTFQAMGGEGSMVSFVDKKWASKDYTHIGYPGGKYIATELVRSLLYGYRAYNGEDLDLQSIAAPDYSVPTSLPEAVHVEKPGNVDSINSQTAPLTTPPTQTPIPATSTLAPSTSTTTLPNPGNKPDAPIATDNNPSATPATEASGNIQSTDSTVQEQ